MKRKISVIVLIMMVALLFASCTRSLNIRYIIEFESNGGTKRASIRFDEFESIRMPGNPTKENYTFDGWFWDDNVWEKPFTVNSILDQPLSSYLELKVYAKWVSDYVSVNYYSDNIMIETITIDRHGLLDVPDEPLKAGHTFAGWETDDMNLWDFEADKASMDMSLRAKWSANIYEISFDADGGSAVPSIERAYQSKITEEPFTQKDGYDFDGWYSKSDLSGSKVIFPLEVTADATLYAKWAERTVKVIFSYINVTKNILPDTVIGELPDAQKPGHSFMGWYTQPDGNGDKITADSVIARGDWQLTLFPYFYSASIIVDFVTNSNDVIDPRVVVFGGEFGTLPSYLTRSGYTFEGWWDNADYSGPAVTAETIVNKDKSFSLYAKWRGNTYQLTYVYNSGHESTYPVFFGSTYNDSMNGDWYADYVFGYIFLGWWTEEGGAGREITRFSTVSIEGDHRVYSKFIKDEDAYVNSPDGKAVFFNDDESTQFSYVGINEKHSTAAILKPLKVILYNYGDHTSREILLTSQPVSAATDGDYLALGYGNAIVIYDISTLEVVETLSMTNFAALQMHGQKLIIASRDTYSYYKILIYDIVQKTFFDPSIKNLSERVSLSVNHNDGILYIGDTRATDNLLFYDFSANEIIVKKTVYSDLKPIHFNGTSVFFGESEYNKITGAAGKEYDYPGEEYHENYFHAIAFVTQQADYDITYGHDYCFLTDRPIYLIRLYNKATKSYQASYMFDANTQYVFKIGEKKYLLLSSGQSYIGIFDFSQ